MQATFMQTGQDFDAIVRAHQTDIWRFLRVLGCEPAQAEDLAQETFLALLKSPFEDRGEVTTLAWLRRVAKNLFISSIRQTGRRPAVTNLDDIDVAWGEAAGEDGGETRVEALKRCMEGLDERQRSALELRYVRGAGREEVGASLGLSDGGTKNLLERVKAKLRECVERRLSHDA